AAALGWVGGVRLLFLEVELAIRQLALELLLARPHRCPAGVVEPERAKHGGALQHEERGVAAGDVEAARQLDRLTFGLWIAALLEIGDAGRRVQARDEGVAGARRARQVELVALLERGAADPSSDHGHAV